MEGSRAAALTQVPGSRDSTVEVSILIPARNEEASLGACLASLSSQAGVTCEIIVADDGSSDRTGEIAQSFAGVRVITPAPLPPGWMGKNNALVTAAKQARGTWLLLTDADTVHEPGSLARALDEAKEHKADLLSYSPRQVVRTLAERAVMPVVFAELAAQYPPRKVRDPNSGVVAANGQYVLVRRAAYEAVGGNAAVAAEILEDVALAKLFRKYGYRMYFRYGGDAVSTRMYRNWQQLRDGWTKNLALLFPRTASRAAQSLMLWLAAWLGLAVAVWGGLGAHAMAMAWAAIWILVYLRIRAANFAVVNNLLAIAFGPPLFTYLLLRSGRAHRSGRVSWKGRTYHVGATDEADLAERAA